MAQKYVVYTYSQGELRFASAKSPGSFTSRIEDASFYYERDARAVITINRKHQRVCKEMLDNLNYTEVTFNYSIAGK